MPTCHILVYKDIMFILEINARTRKGPNMKILYLLNMIRKLRHITSIIHLRTNVL